jgi:hypothetical protein
MQTVFLAATAVLAFPAIVIFLLLGWRFSWRAEYPSFPWMLAAMVLSAWCVFVVKILASISPSGSSDKRTRGAVDKLSMMLVAIGILWVLFLALDMGWTLRMFGATGVVDSIENGRAEVLFTNQYGTTFGNSFPVFDNFSTLRVGERVSLRTEWKIAKVASRTCVFTAFGAATGAILIAGGFFARRNPLRCSIAIRVNS